jgi:hypothetical protein
MRRQSIVKSLTVVAALSACAVAAPTALAHTADDPTPYANNAGPVAHYSKSTPYANNAGAHYSKSTPYANNAGAHYSKSTPYANNAGPVAGLGYNVPPPDTSKAVVVKQQPSSSDSNDKRSPDAIAAAADPRTRTYASPTVVKLSSDSGFDWGDAGIGAGGALAVLALAGGGLVLVSRRRTTHPRVSPTG